LDNLYYPSFINELIFKYTSFFDFDLDAWNYATKLESKYKHKYLIEVINSENNSDKTVLKVSLGDYKMARVKYYGYFRNKFNFAIPSNEFQYFYFCFHYFIKIIKTFFFYVFMFHLLLMIRFFTYNSVENSIRFLFFFFFFLLLQYLFII